MKGTRIVRVVYADVRGLEPRDIPSYMDAFSKSILFGTDDGVENILVPVRSETRIEHFVLDLDQVKVSKVMEYATVEELRRQYSNA
jgi:hypothetical protein